MTSKALSIQAQVGDSKITVPLDRLVNGRLLAEELMRPAPPGFVANHTVVTISDATLDWGSKNENPDLHKIKGGGADYTWAFVKRCLSPHGVEEAGSQVKSMVINDKPGLCVTAACRRRRFGEPDEVAYGNAAESFAMAIEKAKPRDGYKSEGDQIDVARVMVKRLTSEAFKAAARKLLQLPKADPSIVGKALAFRRDVLDIHNPEMQRYAFEKATAAASDLFGGGSIGPGIDEAIEVETIILDDQDEPGRADDGETSAQVAGGADPFAISSSGGDLSATQPIESLDLPEWARSCARDELGDPRWETITVAQLEITLRARLRSTQYDSAGDPAGLIPAGKAGDWAVVADKLLAFERKGGGANA